MSVIRIAILGLIIATCTRAEVLRLPRHAVKRSPEDASLTGLPADERALRKKYPEKLEIVPDGTDEAGKLIFTNIPGRRDDKKAVAEIVSMPYAQKEAFLEALKSAERRGREASRTKENSETLLFATDDKAVSLVLVTDNNGKVWNVELGVGSKSYALGRNEIQSLYRSVKRM